MTWGTGPWGAGSPWGTGSTLPPPSLIGVSSSPGPTAQTAGPAVVDENGGTVCLVVGNNFFDPMTIDILTGGPGAYTVVGTGYVVTPKFDLQRNRCYFGAPALERGLYHIRVTTAGGVSGVLHDAIAAREFADEFKTVSVRSKYASKWETGPRRLRG